jgi:hypothetical protein
MAARIATARQLSAALGADHDIAVVMAALGTKEGQKGDGGRGPTARQRQALMVVAATRQDELRQQAMGFGRLLFAEPPDTFGARIAAYWESAVATVDGIAALE